MEADRVKREIKRKLAILLASGAFVFLSLEAGEVRFADNTAPVKMVFQKIEVVDEAGGIQKKSVGEDTAGEAQVIQYETSFETMYLQQNDETWQEEEVGSLWLNNVKFSVPWGDRRIFGYPVFMTEYMGAREKETLEKWNEIWRDGVDCADCRGGIDAARKWIAEGNLQKPLEEFLECYPQICPDKREYILRITRAEEVRGKENATGWWAVGFRLETQADNGENVYLAYGEIRRAISSLGCETDIKDARFTIDEQERNLWRLVERPEEDRGTVWIDTQGSDFSAVYGMEEDEREQWALNYMAQQGEALLLPDGAGGPVSWKCRNQDGFYYDYLVCIGETDEYEVRMEIPLMPKGNESWYLASRIRKEAWDKEKCTHALSVIRQTFHAVPYEYVVKEGDTLYGIAQKYMGKGSLYGRLAFKNRIEDAALIYPGEKITIPQGKK